MATTRKGGRYVLPAAADLSGLQYTIVRQVAQTVAAATSATQNFLGILQNKPVSGAPAEVIGRHADETSKLKLGGTVAVGDKLTSNGSGLGVVTTTAGNQVVAIANAAGVSGDIIEVTPVYDVIPA